MRILLVASTGGHLSQLVELESAWQDHERHWVTFDKKDARIALAGEDVSYAFHPTTRNLPNALRNALLAISVLRRVRPDLVVSTGAGVAVPFFVVARTMRIRTAYLEVYDRITLPTLSGRICYPISDVFMVQWPEQLAAYPDAELVGPVY